MFNIKKSIVIFFLFICAVYFYQDSMIDDTFIYLQYVKNLSNGDGFVFNIGEPSYGVTGPLWVLLLTAFSKLFVNIVLTAKFASIISGLFAVIIFYLLANKLIRDENISFLATCAWIIDPWFCRNLASGMETSFSLFLVMLFIYLYITEREKNGYFIISPLILGLSILTRPETFLFIPIVLFDMFFIEKLRINDFLRKSTIFISICIIITFPWFIFAYLKFGSIIPSPMVAKGGAFSMFPKPVSILKDIIKITGTTYIIEIILFLSILFIFLKKKRFFIENKLFYIPLLWIGCWILLHMAKNALDVPTRYLLSIIPFIIIYGFWALKIQIAGKVRYLIVSLIFMQLTALNIFVSYPHTKKSTESLKNVHFEIAKWIKSNTPLNSKIAVGELGIIPYYSERYTVDIVGLVNKNVLPYAIANKKLEFIKITKPDYLIIEENKEGLWAENNKSFKAQFILSRKQYGFNERYRFFYTLYKLNW